MTRRRVVDVSALPTGEFGHPGLIWWGTVGFMVIEASMFAIVLVAYFYLRLEVSAWPPSRPDPDPFYGTINLLVVLVSLGPAYLAKRAAEKQEKAGARRWTVILTLFGLVSCGLRVLEYTALNCRWDDNAYGSIVWLLLSLHTTHISTDVVDSAVLVVMMFRRPFTRPRFIDVSENALYWFFIVATWVPIYAVIYFAPRVL